jgi:hypothetical protein
MPCAVKSIFLNRFTDLSLKINQIDSHIFPGVPDNSISAIRVANFVSIRENIPNSGCQYTCPIPLFVTLWAQNRVVKWRRHSAK